MFTLFKMVLSFLCYYGSDFAILSVRSPEHVKKFMMFDYERPNSQLF